MEGRKRNINPELVWWKCNRQKQIRKSECELSMWRHQWRCRRTIRNEHTKQHTAKHAYKPILQGTDRIKNSS